MEDQNTPITPEASDATEERSEAVSSVPEGQELGGDPGTSSTAGSAGPVEGAASTRQGTTGVLRAAGILMTATLISRLLGFVRERAVADIFGRSSDTDAYTAAFGIPDLMYMLLVGGALSAAFIPVFTEYLARDQEEEAWRIGSTFINVTLGVLLLFLVLGIIFTPQLAPLVAYEFAGEQRLLLIRLMRITFPAVFFTALAGLQMGVLNSYRHFTAPALGPILYNLGIIGGTYILGPRLGVVGMAYGAVAGAAANFLVQLPAIWRYARRFYRPRVDLQHPAFRRMLTLMGPAVIGLSIGQLNVILTQNLASGLSSGSMTALRLANRVMQFPLGIFAMGLSQAIFPTLTRQAALNEIDRLRYTVVRSLRLVLFLTIPAAAGMMVLGRPIVRFLFQTGAFDDEDTAATAAALSIYSVGMIGLAGVQILARVFYSLKDTRTPVRVAAINLLVNFGLGLLFLRFTSPGYLGLALSFALAALAAMGSYLWHLHRRIGPIGYGPILKVAILTGIACIPLALAAWQGAALVRSLLGTASMAARTAEVGAGVIAGIMGFAIAAYLLHVDEAVEIWRMVRRKAGAFGSD
ncbi:MAG: murein biosynthesis integral membrane protein MurJ [Limnochordales bacterium]|nr:murein biosynthesis integral membrane protein MurJ [Limnochordales bacterium]